MTDFETRALQEWEDEFGGVYVVFPKGMDDLEIFARHGKDYMREEATIHKGMFIQPKTLEAFLLRKLKEQRDEIVASVEKLRSCGRVKDCDRCIALNQVKETITPTQ